MLTEKGKTIFKEDEVASTLNNYSSNIVKSLNIPEHHINALHHRLSNHSTLKAILRISRPEVFCKKRVLRSFTKFTGGQTCKFIKKETLAQVFSYEFCETSKNTFFHITPLVAAFVSWSIRITLVLTPLGVLPNIYQVFIFPKSTKKLLWKKLGL